MLDFKAALFDMDGTLIDSMGVWARVDDIFFARRGLIAPPSYAVDISGMSFRETGEYTKERFALAESVEDILGEWNELCQNAYENEVSLKPHALEYLKKLKREGKKLAVATALPERLYRPALARNKAYELFDAFASTDETGKGKHTGEVYLLAAARLNVKPRDCAVFEDICEGLMGAKAAGMRAVLVYDSAAASSRERALELCDAHLDNYADWL